MEQPLDLTFGSRLRADIESADDYRRQRKRVGRDLVRLKRSLLLVNKNTKDYLSHDKTKGISSEDFDRDNRHATVFLLTAERDFLYAMEIKVKLDYANEKTSSYMKLMRTRLKRAIYNFQRILSIFESMPVLQKVEYYVYGALLQGLYAVSRKKWSVAINLYSIARCCLDILLNSMEESADVFDKTVLTDLIENTVIPSTKFAVIQEGVESPLVDLTSLARKRCHDNLVPYLAPAVQTIDDLSSDATMTEEDLVRTVQWRDHEADIYDDELARKIMDIKKLSSDIDSDEIVEAWSVALDLFLRNESDDDDDIDKVQNNAILKTYIRYHHLFARLDATFQTSKLEPRMITDLVAIVDEIKELPGVYNDEELYKALDQLRAYFTLYQVKVCADAYSNKKMYSKSLKIWNHICKEIADEDISDAASTFPCKVVSKTTLVAFVSEAKTKLRDAHIGAQFQHDATPAIKSTLMENGYAYAFSLDTFDYTSLHPILSKPVLFDIAFNYIDYAQSGSKQAAASPVAGAQVSGNEQQEKKSGGSSFFGIFGGRS